MSTSRRFLLASSLARLIQKERGGQRVSEGYFPERSGRSSWVRIDGRSGSLALITQGPDRATEEQTEIPRAHAEALLAVTAGELDYVRTSLSIGTREAHVSQLITLGPLEIIDMQFERENEARDFHPPAWFGPDVTADPRYRNQSVALEGPPEPLEVPLTNEALDSLLDALENWVAVAQPRAAARQFAHPPSARPLLKAEANLAGETSAESDEVRELARSLRPHRR
jgi:CYTH domain-containing protein